MASPQERRPELTREIRAGACRCRPGRVVADPWRSSPAVWHLVTQRRRGGFGLSDSDAEPARAVWRESVLVSSALACRHIFVRGSMASFGTTRRSVQPHWRERRHCRQEASAKSKCCHAVRDCRLPQGGRGTQISRDSRTAETTRISYYLIFLTYLIFLYF